MPIGLAHDGANRNDQPLLAPTLNSIPIERPKPTPERPQGLCLDRGYDSPPMRDLAIEHGYTPHISARSWLNRNRAILIRWSKKDNNHLALLQLACGLIAFKKARAATPTTQPG